jgi:hypothetical protein
MSASEPHDYVGEGAPKPKPKPAGASIPYRVLQAVASLRVTVVLFALSMVLVFFGTIAMKHDSIHGVLGNYFRSWFTWIELRLVSDFLIVFFQADKDWVLPGKLPFPGGYVIGWAMFFNLLAAHAIRFKLTWKRSGIFLLHAGVIVLLAGEFLTGQMAVETNMRITEGEESDYAYSLTRIELAVADPSDPAADQVVVVPGSLLTDAKKGAWFSHPDLPFEVQVVEFFPNSDLRDLKPGETGPADQGFGKYMAIESRPKVKGTDTDSKVDLPSAYLALRDKAGQPLGTYLVSTILQRSQSVETGDKTYRMALRFERTYKPYRVHVDSAEHKKYAGTETPKDYASTVRVIEPNGSEYGPVRIWMNHPMYYRGETFYQSGMYTDPETGLKTTTLQVVYNPAWTAPYAACIMVALGMLIHFGIKLLAFLNRGSK